MYERGLALHYEPTVSFFLLLDSAVFFQAYWGLLYFAVHCLGFTAHEEKFYALTADEAAHHIICTSFYYFNSTNDFKTFEWLNVWGV